MSTRKCLRPRPPGSAVPEGLLCVSVQVDAHSCPRHLVRRGRNTPWLGIRREGCLPRTSSVSDSSQKPPVRGGPAPTPGGLVNRLSEFMGELAVTPSPSAGQGSPPRLFWGCPPPSPAGGPALVSAQAVTSGNPRRPALGGARTGDGQPPASLGMLSGGYALEGTALLPTALVPHPGATLSVLLSLVPSVTGAQTLSQLVTSRPGSLVLADIWQPDPTNGGLVQCQSAA